MTTTPVDQPLRSLVSGQRPCPNCGIRADDPAHPAELVIEVDLEDGGYGETGWVGSPRAEARLECTAPDREHPDLRCRGWFCELDLDSTVDLAQELLNHRLHQIVQGNGDHR